ncbi:MAG: hypothetical protein WKF30_16430 [Pyrinomonadaceae bacterium]
MIIKQDAAAVSGRSNARLALTSGEENYFHGGRGRLALPVAGQSELAREAVPEAAASAGSEEAVSPGFLRGGMRAGAIAYVLGSLGLYLFLENYEARAKFTQRTAERLREQAAARGPVA